MADERDYAPHPGEIKKVILITRSGDQVKTYEDLIEAVTAVYRLDDDMRAAVEMALKFTTDAGGGS